MACTFEISSAAAVCCAVNVFCYQREYSLWGRATELAKAKTGALNFVRDNEASQSFVSRREVFFEVARNPQKSIQQPSALCKKNSLKMFYLMGRMGRMGRVGRVGRVGRSPKVSFKFLQTLWVFRTYIYILVYEIKIVTNILMGFKMWCQVGGGGIQFSKLPYVREFSNIWFQKLTDIRCISHFFENLKNVFSNAYLKKFASERVTFFFVFIWIQTSIGDRVSFCKEKYK